SPCRLQQGDVFCIADRRPTMNQQQRFAPLAAALALAAGLAAVPAARAADTIKLAIVGPMTGALTQYGDMVKEGVSTAVERINAAGGVDGKQLEVVTIDDGCEPKQGPVAANR